MQVSVEVVNEVKRRLTIVIPASQIEEAYTSQINHYAKSANIKGFRPGKAPLSFIKQRFGDDARKEAYGNVIQNALYEALTEKNLKPVSTPQIEPKKMIADEPFEFVASFEVLPEIGEIQFDMDNIDKLTVDVTQDDINHVVEQLKKQYTKWHVVDRAVQDKDRVVLDYLMVVDGKPDTDNKINNFPLEMGSQIMIPGFEEGLIGAMPNEERTLHLKFPEDFPVSERAGKSADFIVTIKQIFEADAPTIDSKFIKGLGIASGELEDLYRQIRQSLEIEKNRLIREKQKEQVFSILLEKNPIAVPASMIEREAKTIHDEVYAQHTHHDHNHSDEEMAQFNDVAKKRVALGLLIAQFAKQVHLKVDQDKVRARIEEIASIYEKPEEVKSWLSSEDRLSGIEAQIMEDQVIDKLIENVPVNEKSITYAELKGLKVSK